MTYRELAIEKLDEVLKGISGVRDLINEGGVPENEDWMKAAAPMHELMNVLLNYRKLKDEEVGESVASTLAKLRKARTEKE